VRLLAALIAAACLSVPLAAVGAAPAQAPGSVTLTGTIANGTAGAPVPAGLSVTATEVDAQATKQVATKTAPVSAAGTFSVSGFPGNPGDRYVVGTDHRGVTYSTEAKAGSPTTLKIYETTADSSVVSIRSETLTVLVGKQGNYNVLSVLIVHNGTDRSYVGTPPSGGGAAPALELPIAGGATAFSPVQGLVNGFAAAPDGLVASTDPVLPGDAEISYLYNIAVPRSGWGMTLPVVYPTGQVDLLLDQSLTASGGTLTFRQWRTIAKHRYRDYMVANLGPGTTLSANVAPTATTPVVLYLGLGALVVLIAVGGFGVPRLLRRRRDHSAAEPEPRRGDRERLVEEIAALDEAHEAGSVDDEDYAEQRAELKGQLVRLVERPSGGPPQSGRGTPEGA